MIKYILMHKNDKCGTILFDENIGRITEYHDDRNGLSPYLGNCDIKKIQKWWEMRAVPASRATMQQVINNANCLNTEVYLAKNLGLSMTDTYWIKPSGIDLSFNNVKFANLAAYSHGKIPYHNATSYDPNASLGGQMEKYWDLMHKTPILVKESYKYYGQQSINEVFASIVHSRQPSNVEFVRYTAEMTEDRGVQCKCPAFTSENIELLSAYEMVESRKIQNSQALYDEYINICVENGIDYNQIQEFMDYQTMTDFLITNTDEHLLNFGVLRDPNTMKLIGPAPIFDSGNSMFYSDGRKTPYTRAGILDIPITSFYKREEKLLGKVKNKTAVDLNSIPSAGEVKELYANAGIPEEKADVISKNYDTKAKMLSEFQRGKTISLYKEKQAEKNSKYNTIVKEPEVKMESPKFIMLCGIPGSGKSQLAKSLYADLQNKKMDDVNLYPASKAIKNIGLIFDPSKITNDIVINADYKDSTVLISPNKIRQELKDNYPDSYSESLVFAIVDARIKTALKSGASVVYEATNLDKPIREKYLGIANEYGVKDTSLHVTWINPNDSISSISPNLLSAMNNRLVDSNPSKDEGWSDFVQHGMPAEKIQSNDYFDMSIDDDEIEYEDH
ncbi:AAA family ATPase [Blautia sp. MSK.20.9]|jgi:predicted kinase|uniref:AAA family ATPase n=1 Tax=Blautia sp. MSK20_18 TaxID=2883186 RepID=UPI0015712594|nr:AAA family ATPase [Blautia sp. MSK20_18]MCB7508818.1 AAA family ATPase [Blautia sp. MSK20_18]NSK12497.1 AAA family ATPase [Blautia sp. MSK.20.9]